MSQNELANLLQMTQSFLSAIENGKSPLPIEKEEKVCEVFGIKNLNDYILDKKDLTDRSITEMTDSDLFQQLLSRFHKQAHSGETEHHHHNHHRKIDELEERASVLYERNDALMIRNDRLSEDNDFLRKEIDAYRLEIEKLRQEVFQLKNRLITIGEKVN